MTADPRIAAVAAALRHAEWGSLKGPNVVPGMWEFLAHKAIEAADAAQPAKEKAGDETFFTTTFGKGWRALVIAHVMISGKADGVTEELAARCAEESMKRHKLDEPTVTSAIAMLQDAVFYAIFEQAKGS